MYFNDSKIKSLKNVVPLRCCFDVAQLIIVPIGTIIIIILITIIIIIIIGGSILNKGFVGDIGHGRGLVH